MKQTNSWSEITTLSVSEFKILNIRPRAIGKINGDKTNVTVHAQSL